MAKINIQNDPIPLSAYLRADPHSQVYMTKNEDGERNELVSFDMFWGDANNEALYLDYLSVVGRNITVSQGIAENCQAQTLRDEYCDGWINENLAENNMSKLYVIRGYAGCGKTTFINYLMHKRKKHINTTYVDVSEKWSYHNEPYMFFTLALNEIDKCIESIACNVKLRDKIWEEFIGLGSDGEIDRFEPELPNIMSGLISIKNQSDWKNLTKNIHQYLYNSYSEKDMRFNERAFVENRNIVWHSIGQTGVIIAVLVLLVCAQHNIEQPDNREHTLIFDNLDVITNPAIPSETIVSLWGVINGYNEYLEYYSSKYNKKLLNFNIIIAVRKVLYSHIVSHLPDLEMAVNYDAYYVNVCDISNLYLSQCILEHRINYWKNHIDNSETINKLSQLAQITTVVSNSEEVINENKEQVVQHSINLDALFNHNYRAFSNMLSAFFDDTKYSINIIPDFKKGSSSTEWQKVATLIFSISLFYRKAKVWNELGFGCKDFNIADYPTTFNRLILNYLYVAKRGQELRRIVPGRSDIPYEGEVSLKELIDVFEKVKFISATVDSNEEQLKLQYKQSNNTDSTELLLVRLADMCARNPRIINSKAYGYDSENDELWRRPMFFTGGIKLGHTATSDKELKKYFNDCVNMGDTEKIKFSITDEGFTLIKDIVANFEFYSARYCDESKAKPLHQATSDSEIDMLILPVYNAIKLCCSRHNLFMKQYMNNYKMGKNAYLRKNYHPRTNPRYNHKRTLKELDQNSFRPQLHIVRVIYSHIAYFYEIKELLEHTDNEKNIKMRNCLSGWIDEYLLLYRVNFFDNLKNTVCYSDNNVYNELVDRSKKEKTLRKS